MSASTPSPDGVVENDRHHHHDHHTVEMDAAAAPGPTPDADPVGVIEAALVRLVDDVGVPPLHVVQVIVVILIGLLNCCRFPGSQRLIALCWGFPGHEKVQWNSDWRLVFRLRRLGRLFPFGE